MARGSALSTKEGFAIVGAGQFADWIQFRMPGGDRRDIQVEGAQQKSRFTLREELTHTRAMATYGNAKVGKAVNVESVGQVTLRGGVSGYGFTRLTMAGVADAEWLAAFVAQKDAK